MSVPANITNLQRAQILLDMECMSMGEICAKSGIGKRTLYRWRLQYLSPETDEDRAIYDIYKQLKREGMTQWRDSVGPLLNKLINKLSKCVDNVDEKRPETSIPLVVSAVEAIGDVESTFRVLDSRVPLSSDKVRPLWPNDRDRKEIEQEGLFPHSKRGA